jgi:hypothetical protein
MWPAVFDAGMQLSVTLGKESAISGLPQMQSLGAK